jgi:hypothetical protein
MEFLSLNSSKYQSMNPIHGSSTKARREQQRLPKYVLVMVMAIVTIVIMNEDPHYRRSSNTNYFFCHANPVYACNICRNPPTGTRTLINGGTTFKQSNGVTMSCTDLQLSVQDVNPTATGAAGEARLCATAQYLAYQYCSCTGTAIPPPTDNYKDPAPACNLCGASGLDFPFVPAPNTDKLTDTKVAGQQSCSGLYLAAAKGVLSANLCPTIQQNSGPDCCNLVRVQPRVTPIPPTPAPVVVVAPPPPSPAPGTCVGPLVQCNTPLSSLPCCAGYECRPRAIGEQPICSAVSKQVKDRITTGTTGGAGSRPRTRGGT